MSGDAHGDEDEDNQILDTSRDLSAGVDPAAVCSLSCCVSPARKPDRMAWVRRSSSMRRGSRRM